MRFGPQPTPTTYQPHKTGYAIINAAGLELQWAETLPPLLTYIEEKREVRVVRCKDQAVVWPAEQVRNEGSDAE